MVAAETICYNYYKTKKVLLYAQRVQIIAY